MTTRMDLLASVIGNRVAADASKNARAAGTSAMPTAMKITLERIDADPSQPRREFDQEELDRLAASIRQQSLQLSIGERHMRTHHHQPREGPPQVVATAQTGQA